MDFYLGQKGSGGLRNISFSLEILTWTEFEFTVKMEFKDPLLVSIG